LQPPDNGWCDSSSKISDINYTWIPSFVYQYVVTLIVRFPVRRIPSIFMHVAVWEHCIGCGKVCYSKPIIIIINNFM
jgi:hypothetical protein